MPDFELEQLNVKTTLSNNDLASGVDAYAVNLMALLLKARGQWLIREVLFSMSF